MNFCKNYFLINYKHIPLHTYSPDFNVVLFAHHKRYTLQCQCRAAAHGIGIGTDNRKETAYSVNSPDWPCGLGIRIQPTLALVRVVRVD